MRNYIILSFFLSPSFLFGKFFLGAHKHGPCAGRTAGMLRSSLAGDRKASVYYVTNHDYDYAANTLFTNSPPCPTTPPPQRSKLTSKVCPFRPCSLETDDVNNSLGPSELKLQISITTDKTVLELKQAIAEKSDVGADRQRLIYSGSSPLSSFC